VLEIKYLINQIKSIVEIFTNALDYVEERTLGLNQGQEIMHADSNKEKTKHEHNFQEVWDMIKRLNLRIYGI
jgi:hypothetical protein